MRLLIKTLTEFSTQRKTYPHTKIYIVLPFLYNEINNYIMWHLKPVLNFVLKDISRGVKENSSFRVA